jgi:hypothetical protein
MVPKAVLPSSGVVALREPAAVDLRAKLDADVEPSRIDRRRCELASRGRRFARR